MTKCYKCHGREQDKVVKVTCDAAVETAFLAAMRKERIVRLPASYESLKLTADHLARGKERKRLEANIAGQFVLQSRRSAWEAGLKTTREHFAKMACEVEQRKEWPQQ